MKTIERGHDVLPLNSAARNLAHGLYDREFHGGTSDLDRPAQAGPYLGFEKFTRTAVIVPMLIVLLTILVLVVQYYFLTVHGHMQLPTVVDVPFA